MLVALIYFAIMFCVYSAPTCTSKWDEWSDWSGNCQRDSILVRNRDCVCTESGKIQPYKSCFFPNDFEFMQTIVCNPDERVSIQGFEVENTDNEGHAFPRGFRHPLRRCNWVWSNWEPCSKNCGSGETSRYQECICYGEGVSLGQCDSITQTSNETALCNEHECGTVKAHNLNYWIRQYQLYQRANNETNRNESWPFPDPVFECSVSENEGHPLSGMKLTDVLNIQITSTTYNPEWILLAKHYVVMLLNINNGFKPTPYAQKIMREASVLIESCDTFSTEQMTLVQWTTEQLERMTENIGGVVLLKESKLLFSIFGSYEGSDESRGHTYLFYGAVFVGVFVVIVAIVLVVHLARRRYKLMQEAVVEVDTFSFEEDSLELLPTTPTPLHYPKVVFRKWEEEKDETDSTGEESSR